MSGDVSYFFCIFAKKLNMDFYAEYFNVFNKEEDLIDFPIFRKEEWEEDREHFDEIVRFIVYRFSPKSPVFMKRNNQKRDEEARLKSGLSMELFNRFESGDKLFLSLILGYLQHIRDNEWTTYVMTNTVHTQTARTITEYQNMEFKGGKDKVTTTKELSEMVNALSALGDKLTVLESKIFDYSKGEEETAISLHLKKFAPKMIDGLMVDLIRFPCEYFAEKTRDTFCHETPQKRSKVSKKES